MYKKFLLPFLLTVQITHTYYNPLLVIVIMVKNEASVIQETLLPFVKAGITSFFILDTGSTDNTIAIAKDFFLKNNLNGYIEQESFINFAASRNHALEKAQQQFPNACFMLMPDAEWYINNATQLLQFCNNQQYTDVPAYLIRLINNGIDFYQARLIRCNKNAHFIGPVHEVLNYVAKEKIPPSIFFDVHPSKLGSEKTQQRWKRDLVILLQEYENNPHDPRTIFYLAQTYACLGDWMNACKWYEKRIAIHGWHEENFIARYRLAQTYEQLGSWQQALYHYITAYEERPHRAEPLIKLAQHYLNVGSKPLSKLFLNTAIELPYPESDTLFVEKEVYEKIRYELLKKSNQLHDDVKEIFTKIYTKNAWGNGESRSGSGSTRQQTTTIQTKLPQLIQELNIKTMLDAPCGDCNWIQYVNFTMLNVYIGVDIVDEIIRINTEQKNFAPSTTFLTKNILTDFIPRVDLILCRDCFPHFTYEQTIRALKNFKQSGSTYLLTTTYEKNNTNYTIETGFWMPINLRKSPFNFPEPLLIIDEKATDWCNEKYGKSLALWRLADINIE